MRIKASVEIAAVAIYDFENNKEINKLSKNMICSVELSDKKMRPCSSEGREEILTQFLINNINNLNEAMEPPGLAQSLLLTG